MKFTCKQEQLGKGLAIVGRTIANDNALPVLSNVLITTTDNALNLTSTNLELGVSCIIEANVTEQGSFTIPARLLADYVGSLPKGEITAELKGSALHLAQDGYKANIKGLPADEFPEVPELQAETVLTLDAKELTAGISRVVFAATPDQSRPELSGVFLTISDGVFTLAATDSYRLAEQLLPSGQFSGAAADWKDIIVPARAMQELQRIFSDTEGAIQVAVSDHQVRFQGDNVTIISRLIDGQYPDYKQVMGIEAKTTIKIQATDFLDAIKVTSLFSKSGANDIKIEFSPESPDLVLSAASDSVGDNISRVQALVDGTPGTIVFNYRFLLDGVNQLKRGELVFEISENSTRSKITEAGNENYSYVVMPIRQQ